MTWLSTMSLIVMEFFKSLLTIIANILRCMKNLSFKQQYVDRPFAGNILTDEFMFFHIKEWFCQLFESCGPLDSDALPLDPTHSWLNPPLKKHFANTWQGPMTLLCL